MPLERSSTTPELPYRSPPITLRLPSARLQTAIVALQNLRGSGVGCPVVSTTFLAQQQAIQNGPARAIKKAKTVKKTKTSKQASKARTKVTAKPAKKVAVKKVKPTKDAAVKKVKPAKKVPAKKAKPAAKKTKAAPKAKGGVDARESRLIPTQLALVTVMVSTASRFRALAHQAVIPSSRFVIQ